MYGTLKECILMIVAGESNVFSSCELSYHDRQRTVAFGSAVKVSWSTEATKLSSMPRWMQLTLYRYACQTNASALGVDAAQDSGSARPPPAVTSTHLANGSGPFNQACTCHVSGLLMNHERCSSPQSIDNNLDSSLADASFRESFSRLPWDCNVAFAALTRLDSSVVRPTSLCSRNGESCQSQGSAIFSMQLSSYSVVVIAGRSRKK
eukprot:1407843-Amphidinium_carterae.1